MASGDKTHVEYGRTESGCCRGIDYRWLLGRDRRFRLRALDVRRVIFRRVIFRRVIVQLCTIRACRQRRADVDGRDFWFVT
jgi:hypothetical protein